MPKRIVLVDDDARVRELVDWTFRPPEFEVYAFADGREALTKLQDIEPAVIVSDVAMPDMDGRMLMQAVKGSPTLRNVPFIFLTAVTTRATIEATIEAGAAAFLVKPFPLALLKEKVRQILASGRSADAARVGVPPSLDATGAPAARRAPTHVILEDVRTAPPRFSEQEALNAADKSSDDLFAMLLGEGGGPKPPRSPISGRLSTVETEAGRILVLTEVTGMPTFSITTVIAQGGRGLRKIESSWAHPLQRQEDVELVLRQIDLQHEHALVITRDLRLERPRVVLLGETRRTVETSLLAWALSSIAGEVESCLGRTRTLAALRSTWNEVAREDKTLHAFRILDNGRVVPNHARVTQVSQAVVRGVAAWVATFLAALESSPGALRSRVQAATRERSVELVGAGFYAALDTQRPKAKRPRGAADAFPRASPRPGWPAS